MSDIATSFEKAARKPARGRGFIIAGLISLAILMVYFVIASMLIYWPRKAPFPTPDIDIMAFNAAESPRDYASESFFLADGTELVAHRFGPATDTIVLFMHGVASDQRILKIPALMLQEATGFQVMTIDMRGHGLSSGPRNDVNHIGQYEEDLAEVMTALKTEAPNLNIILAGHSMGGGIAMRYAMMRDVPAPSGYLLFAPNFGEGPTQKKADKTAPPKPADQPSLVHFDTPRMIGQIMMNTIGLHAFDRETILYFNFPPQPQAYSYRAVMSAQPVRPNTADKALKAVKAPLLVLVGSKDEVFNAAGYEAFVSQNSQGETHLVEGESHVSLLFSPNTHKLAGEWASQF